MNFGPIGKMKDRAALVGRKLPVPLPHSVSAQVFDSLVQCGQQPQTAEGPVRDGVVGRSVKRHSARNGSAGRWGYVTVIQHKELVEQRNVPLPVLCSCLRFLLVRHRRIFVLL
jgi:hypothetical protein